MPHRVRTETGALVTLSDDFFDKKVHEEVKGDPDESPLLPDGVTYRPPTYPSKAPAKKAAKKTTAKKAAKKAPTKKAESPSGQTAESTEENG